MRSLVCAVLALVVHDTTAPVLREKVNPVYPKQALDAGIEGTVVLEIFIDAKGNVEHIHVQSSPGYGLDEAAVTAAKQFKFKPATADGEPVASQVVYEQKFAINRTVRSELTAEAPPERTTFVQPSYETVVVGRGPMTSASSSSIRDLDFELRPRNSPNDILRVVPGLVTAQHQGGGKADQLFLRGFDADHGTDVAVFLDGMPVNLPSHAHGQGYADLHFLIPEVLQTVEVEKGSYDPRYGDFDTAGAVNLVTRRAFDRSFVSVTGGSFDTVRFLGVGAANTPQSSSYVALEAAQTDGPFDVSEDLKRYNLFLKSTYDLSASTTIGAMATAYASNWIGSGQIPARLVGSAELPDRFASLDPSEGGSTERESATVFLETRPDATSRFDARLWFVRYKLALFNDFTFFLRDPVNGDEIEQDDARSVLGADASYEINRRWHGANFKTILGAQYRHDDVHVDLWDVTSQNGNFRKRLRRHVETGDLTFGTDDDEHLSNLSFYVDEDVLWTRWLRTVAAVRGDYFDFDVSDLGEVLGPGQPKTSGETQQALLSPKASIVLMPHRDLDIYLNYGNGFHSNDARLAVRGEVGNVIPRSYEWEVGARTHLWDRVDAAFAFWYIYLQSEIVFEGDSGTFSPAGATERYGLDLELRVRLLSWLYADGDVALAHAAFLTGEGVPLAPRLTFTAGLTARHPRGWKGALRVRGVGDRTAGEGLTAQGYTVVDGFVGFEHHWFEVGVALENLLDTDWREAQFANLSCSRSEGADPMNPCHTQPSIHFTPGNPFNVMATARLFF